MSLTAKELSQRYNQQYLDFECIDGLQSLARGLSPNPVIINIGAGYGTSAITFLESRPDARVVTVDAHRLPTPIGGLDSELENVKAAGLFDQAGYEQIESFSIPAGDAWDRGLVDLVFVDASHSYEACKGDALAWMPHLRPGGIMAFHDYWERYGYEVIRAVDEVMAPFEQVMNVSCLVAYRLP